MSQCYTTKFKMPVHTSPTMTMVPAQKENSIASSYFKFVLRVVHPHKYQIIC